MATRQIKHRTGQIEYEFNEQMAWTEADQQMADGLAHCILTSENSMEQTESLWKRGIELSKQVEHLNQQHTKVAEVLEKAQTVAGAYVGAIELGQFGIADMLSEAVNAANEAIQRQNTDIRSLHTVYNALLRDRNRKIDADEDENIKVYDKLTGLFTLGYEASELATELMSFDAATESLRGVLSFNDQMEERKLDSVLSVTRDYELLQARIEGQQKVWEEFCSRLILLEYIGKLRSGNQPTSFN